jgi:hypothetical protein
MVLRRQGRRVKEANSVVPAKAGTHNPWPGLLPKEFSSAPKSVDTAYGSRFAGTTMGYAASTRRKPFHIAVAAPEVSAGRKRTSW